MKGKYLKDTRNKLNRGITLIALIISIIVILILAGASINMIIGENGLIKKTTSAVEKYKQAEIEEKIQMSMASSYMKANGKKPSIDEIIADLMTNQDNGFKVTTTEKTGTNNAEIVINDAYNKLLKQIEVLEKRARTEKQPRKKLELFEQLKELKKKL